MIPVTLQTLKNLQFTPCGQNPVIKPIDGTPVVADPSLLTPDESPDNRWHLFCHTILGVYHLDSADGIHFRRVQKICRDAMRPNINKVNGRYCLFFEKTRSLPAKGMNLIHLAPWHSEIYVTESEDLLTWSKPYPVLTGAKGYEQCGQGSSLSNPFLLREGDVNRLYFSCGLTFIKDCGFCEPTYVSYAESGCLTSGYVPADKPILCPDKNDPFRNLCSGCLKVYRLRDGYAGIQNGIYEKDGRSHSAIVLLSSADGLHFTFEKVLLTPGGAPWQAQYVYASHLVQHGSTLRLYFNARNNSGWLTGRECIGFYEAVLPEENG